MPWGLAAAGIATVGGIVAADKASKTADKAGEREAEAADRAIELQQGAYQDAKALLSPYARQEAAASNQLMMQMGLGGGGGTGGGDGWGYADPMSLNGVGGGSAPRSGMGDSITDIFSNAIAYAGRSGYGSNSKPDKAIAQGARMTIQWLEQAKREGKLPPDYQIPTQQELASQGVDIVQSQGGLKSLRQNYGSGAYGYSNVVGSLTNYGVLDAQGNLVQPDVQAGGPGGQAGGPGQMGGGAGGAMGARDIMALAGVEGLPPEVRDAYYKDLMAGRNPIDLGIGDFNSSEYQNYMGLTPESMQVGPEYQQSPAYQRAVTEGSRTVNTQAANTGSLYSGRRGESLRDVGQQVEQGYYMDAMNRRADMMGARRQTYGAELARRLAEREASLGRMGGEVAAGRQQEQSYYNNYMQMLSSLANPTTTTNIASMGMGIGKDTGAQLVDSTRAVNNLNVAASNANQQAMGDVMGGIMDLGTAWLSNREQ